MMNHLKQWSKPSVQILKNYAIFNFAIVLMSSIILSVIAFFHFLLGHDLAVIENWANLHFWEVLTGLKLLLLWGFKKWTELNQIKTISLKELMKRWTFSYNPQMLVLVIFMNVMFHFMNSESMILNPNPWYFYVSLVSSLGLAGLFFIDYVFLLWLIEIWGEIPKEEIKKFSIMVCLIFALGTSLYLPHMQEKTLLVSLCFLGLWLIHFLHKKSDLDIIVYLLFICAPLGWFWGQDPVWGHEYSLFTLKRVPPFLLIIGWWALGMSYISGKIQISRWKI